MANYFTLTKKGETVPAQFSDIDDNICRDVFNVEPHPVHYYAMWFDIIGINLAYGKTWDEIRERCSGESYDEINQIIDYLEANYETDAWAQWGK